MVLRSWRDWARCYLEMDFVVGTICRQIDTDDSSVEDHKNIYKNANVPSHRDRSLAMQNGVMIIKNQEKDMNIKSMQKTRERLGITNLKSLPKGGTVIESPHLLSMAVWLVGA